MIDIIIPYLKTQDDFELRYSLRSLEKFNVTAFNYKVFIVGGKPEWLTNVIHIPCEDKYTSGRNIMRKLLTASKDARVSDDFAMWQDDYFMTKNFDFTDYPNYHCGGLGELLDTRFKYDGYRIQIDNTFNALALNNKPTLNFDLHCPIIFNKQKFIEVMQQYDWTNKKQGFCIKSLYANHLGLPSQYMADNNFDNHNNKMNEVVTTGHIFSIHPAGLTEEMKQYLIDNYPEKSIYES